MVGTDRAKHGRKGDNLVAETTSLVLGAGVLVTGSTVIRDVHEGKTRAAPIVFGFMAVAALLVISMASDKTARGLSYMLMVGAFVVNGPAVFSIASGISGSKSPGITGLPPDAPRHGLGGQGGTLPGAIA